MRDLTGHGADASHLALLVVSRTSTQNTQAGIIVRLSYRAAYSLQDYNVQVFRNAIMRLHELGQSSQ